MTRRLLHRSQVTLPTAVLVAASVVACSPSSADDAGAETTVKAAAASDGAGQTPEKVMAANLSYAETAALVGQTWDASAEVAVTLSGGTASVDGSGVTVDGPTVTITRPGTYTLSGTLDGQVVVDSADDGVVRLVLDGVDITSPTAAAVTVTDADQVSVVLAEGSTNSLTGAPELDETDEDAPDATLYSTADLAIWGDGSLTVVGRAKDGIGAKDGLVVAADVTVTAVDDGVRGKDYLVVDGGTLVVEAGDDGLKSDNTDDATAGYVAVVDGTVTVTSAGDGFDAASDVVVAGGTVDVVAGGGHAADLADDTSAKGLKGGVSVVVGDDATVTVDAADDGLHSDGAVSVTGGTVQVATGDDGMHADGDLTITGGQVTVSTSVEGLEAATITLAGGTIDITASDDGVNASDGSDDSGDRPGGRGPDEAVDGLSLTVTGGEITVRAGGDGLDSNGTMTMTGGDVVVHGPTGGGDSAVDSTGGFTIEGGTLLALGSVGMAETPGAGSLQGWVASRFDTALSAGARLAVQDPDGNVLATVTLEKSTASVLFSAAGVTTGEQYTVTADGQTVATATAGEAIGGGARGRP